MMKRVKKLYKRSKGKRSKENEQENDYYAGTTIGSENNIYNNNNNNNDKIPTQNAALGSTNTTTTITTRTARTATSILGSPLLSQSCHNVGVLSDAEESVTIRKKVKTHKTDNNSRHNNRKSIPHDLKFMSKSTTDLAKPHHHYKRKATSASLAPAVSSNSGGSGSGSHTNTSSGGRAKDRTSRISCHSSATSLEALRENRLSVISKLDEYIDHVKKSVDDDNIAYAPNRLCCAQLLKAVYQKREQKYLYDSLHSSSGHRHHGSLSRTHKSSSHSLPSSKSSFPNMMMHSPPPSSSSLSSSHPHPHRNHTMTTIHDDTTNNGNDAQSPLSLPPSGSKSNPNFRSGKVTWLHGSESETSSISEEGVGRGVFNDSLESLEHEEGEEGGSSSKSSRKAVNRDVTKGGRRHRYPSGSVHFNLNDSCCDDSNNVSDDSAYSDDDNHNHHNNHSGSASNHNSTTGTNTSSTRTTTPALQISSNRRSVPLFPQSYDCDIY